MFIAQSGFPFFGGMCVVRCAEGIHDTLKAIDDESLLADAVFDLSLSFHLSGVRIAHVCFMAVVVRVLLLLCVLAFAMFRVRGPHARPKPIWRKFVLVGAAIVFDLAAQPPASC